MDKCADMPLLWISGPPGSGKTSLVSSYLDRLEVPYLWYQMDHKERDPATFFHYLSMALGFMVKQGAELLPVFTPDNLNSLFLFSQRYFESLFRCIPKGGLVVFDDYQEVYEELYFRDILHAGLNRIPSGIKMIVISRTKPPPGVTRFRANSKMACLDWNDLRLNTDECHRLIQTRTGMAFSRETAKELRSYTDGWAAGLILLLDGHNKDYPEKKHWELASQEDIFDYFASEIIDRANQTRRLFLYQTALLPKITADSAKRMTGIDTAEKILKGLLEENLFISRKPGIEAVYQYHPLFRRCLLNRLYSETPEKELCALRAKAAEILEKQSLFEDALSLLLESCAWADIVRILLKTAPVLTAENRYQTLEQWLKLLPEHILKKDPWLTYWSAVCRAPGSPLPAQRQFISAFHGFKKNREQARALMAWSGIVDTYLLVFASFKPLDDWLPELEDLLKTLPEFPSPDIEARVTASMITVMGLRQPDHPRFEELLSRCQVLAEENTYSRIKVQAYLPLVFCRLSQGRFQEVRALLESFGRLACEPDIPPLLKVMQKDLEAFFYWKACCLQQCLESAEQGLAIAEETGIPAFRFFLKGHAIAAALSSRDTVKAEEMFQILSGHLDTARAWEKAYYHVMRVWASLLNQDLIAAEGHADLGLKYAREAGEYQSLAYSRLGKALVCHATGEHDNADHHLKLGHKQGFVEYNAFAFFAYRLTEALFAFDRGDTGILYVKLDQALAMGRKKGYFNSYFWRPGVMARLCALALERGIEADYVKKIIKRRNLPMPAGRFQVRQWPCPVKIKTFGRFELTINEQDGLSCEKKQKRPLELLKVILSQGGRKVNKTRVCDILWPDSDGDASQSALSTNLQRLRRFLGDDRFIIVREGAISLNESFCWVDLWQLQALLQELSILWNRKWSKMDQNLAGELLCAALELHEAPFMSEEAEDPPWSLALRIRFQKKLSGWCLALGRVLEDQGRQEEAVRYYLIGRSIEPVREELYQRLIICYLKLGLKAEAMSEFSLCREVMRKHFACEPSGKTRELFNSI